ncbi:MAG TPA: hypothetical protein VJ792_04500 [Candidatus Nitrosotalea sp.]|nr:hypothetical protein [Candidatus Nitrosotalea sp.]
MEPEIREIIEKNMDLMLKQTKVYMPFLRVAFPAAPNLQDLCYNLMVGNALTTFLSQYALRMTSPTEKDFAEFGLVVEQYREKIKGLF